MIVGQFFLDSSLFFVTHFRSSSLIDPGASVCVVDDDRRTSFYLPLRCFGWFPSRAIVIPTNKLRFYWKLKFGMNLNGETKVLTSVDVVLCEQSELIYEVIAFNGPREEDAQVGEGENKSDEQFSDFVRQYEWFVVKKEFLEIVKAAVRDSHNYRLIIHRYGNWIGKSKASSSWDELDERLAECVQPKSKQTLIEMKSLTEAKYEVRPARSVRSSIFILQGAVALSDRNAFLSQTFVGSDLPRDWFTDHHVILYLIAGRQFYKTHGITIYHILRVLMFLVYIPGFLLFPILFSEVLPEGFTILPIVGNLVGFTYFLLFLNIEVMKLVFRNFEFWFLFLQSIGIFYASFELASENPYQLICLITIALYLISSSLVDASPVPNNVIIFNYFCASLSVTIVIILILTNVTIYPQKTYNYYGDHYIDYRDFLLNRLAIVALFGIKNVVFRIRNPHCYLFIRASVQSSNQWKWKVGEEQKSSAEVIYTR